MIKVLLWDIDGTLLNFVKAEYYAVKKCFSIFNLGECTDEMIARYSEINTKYWERLERGEVTKAEVLSGRFREFFEKENIIFSDIDAFNKEYQLRLGDKVFFNDNGYDIVSGLKGRVMQYAVTNGTYRAQKRKLETSGLKELFDDVFISDLVGFEKPSIEFFRHVEEKIGHYEKDEVMIIGDSLTGDMQGGNNAGILCCWYNPDRKPGSPAVKIDYEIRDLNEIPGIIQKIFE